MSISKPLLKIIHTSTSIIFTLGTQPQERETNNVFNANQTIKDVHFLNDSIVIVVSALYSGTGLQVKKSTNIGLSWTAIQTRITDVLVFII